MSKETTASAKFTHFNADGEANMVDVVDKAITQRIAVAEGVIRMLPTTLVQIESGDSHKGDVLGIARIAGIMAAKKTADLIPLCHPLALNKVSIEFAIDKEKNQIRCQAMVKISGKTGVEMEALTAVQISLLTIYDMCKAVDRGMTINQVRLLKKSGGKSGDWKLSD